MIHYRTAEQPPALMVKRRSHAGKSETQHHLILLSVYCVRNFYNHLSRKAIEEGRGGEGKRERLRGLSAQEREIGKMVPLTLLSQMTRTEAAPEASLSRCSDEIAQNNRQPNPLRTRVQFR